MSTRRGGSGETLDRHSGIGGVARTLSRIRSLAWSMLVAQQAGRTVALLLGGVVAAILLDYFLRTPAWLRAGVWTGGVALLGMAFWRWVRPAMKFNPSLTEVALRIEQSNSGKEAGLSGTLAAGLELGNEHGAEPVVQGAVERFSRVRMSSILSGARLGRVAAGVLLAAGYSRSAINDVLRSLGLPSI
jgi:hypothetical protein